MRTPLSEDLTSSMAELSAGLLSLLIDTCEKSKGLPRSKIEIIKEKDFMAYQSLSDV
jgi:hypothetical protein